MKTYKFEPGRSYMISDVEKRCTAKITVLSCKKNVYYIHWHDEGKGEFCCSDFFDECFEIIKELKKGNSSK